MSVASIVRVRARVQGRRLWPWHLAVDEREHPDALVGVELGDGLDGAVGALGLAEAEERGLGHMAEAL